MLDVRVLIESNIDPGNCVMFPATIITANVSPIALPIPNIMPVSIPGNAAGTIIFLIVCHLVAPSPNDASLYSLGTAFSASCDTLMMVGRIITASIIAAVNMLNPVPPKFSLTSGTKTVSPKNPYTTDGIPANVSITGFSIFRMYSGAISTMNIAHNIESGTAISNARAVTASVPTIMVPDPNIPFVGSHIKPEIKLNNPYSTIAGYPSMNMKTIIIIIVNIEKIAHMNSNLLRMDSFSFLFSIYVSLLFFFMLLLR